MTMMQQKYIFSSIALSIGLITQLSGMQTTSDKAIIYLNENREVAYPEQFKNPTAAFGFNYDPEKEHPFLAQYTVIKGIPRFNNFLPFSYSTNEKAIFDRVHSGETVKEEVTLNDLTHTKYGKIHTQQRITGEVYLNTDSNIVCSNLKPVVYTLVLTKEKN